MHSIGTMLLFCMTTLYAAEDSPHVEQSARVQDFCVRWYQEQDYKMCDAIAQASQPWTKYKQKSPKAWHNYFPRQLTLVVCDQHNMIHGFIKYALHSNTNPTIYNLAVKDLSQYEHIGRKLIATIVELYKEQNYIVASVHSHNFPALKLYKTFQFQHNILSFLENPDKAKKRQAAYDIIMQQYKKNPKLDLSNRGIICQLRLQLTKPSPVTQPVTQAVSQQAALQSAVPVVAPIIAPGAHLVYYPVYYPMLAVPLYPSLETQSK